MLNLVTTTDKLQLVTNAAVAVDVHASYMDYNGSSVTPGKQNTAISTATTTDIVAAPGSSTYRNVKTLNIRNKDASNSVDVTVVFDQNGTDFELHRVTLKAGEALEYIEGVGFYPLKAAALDRVLRVTSNVVNATTSLADVTGLIVPVESSKHYVFEAMLSHETNATTTGARFAVNGPAMTAMWVGQYNAQTPGIAATNIAVGVATALETIISASTTGPGATRTFAQLTGYINPSANGNFAIRCSSEVAVASGLTVHAGSWLEIREVTG